MEPQFGEITVRCGGCFACRNELFPVGGLGVVFDVLDGGKVIVEDAVMLRRDMPGAWMKDEGNVASMLRGMSKANANACMR